MTPEELDSAIAPHIRALQLLGDDAMVGALVELAGKVSEEGFEEFRRILDAYDDLPD